MQMPWGKYKGEEIEDIPSGYLRWLARECDDEEIAMTADTEYQHREKYNVHIF
jgi:hypothetical protein